MDPACRTYCCPDQAKALLCASSGPVSLANQHYRDWCSFSRSTGVDRAVQIVATGSSGAPQP
jgi:hypothetical protein